MALGKYGTELGAWDYASVPFGKYGLELAGVKGWGMWKAAEEGFEQG